jgi:hypothetical protein
MVRYVDAVDGSFIGTLSAEDVGAVKAPTVRRSIHAKAGFLKLSQDIEFKGPATGAPQTAILYGDPTKLGLFVIRVKFSAGWKHPPHWHPDEVRSRGLADAEMRRIMCS